MKPVTEGETLTISEDKIRKSLHELQPSAIDKETLVGADRMLRSTKESKATKLKSNVSQKTKDAPKQKKVTTKTKAVQTAQEEKVESEPDDLISTAGPSENYWQVLAEKRRKALKNTLEENKRLSEEKEELAQRVEQLEEENRICKEMLDETKALVEVLQDMIGDDRSGINNSLEDSLL